MGGGTYFSSKRLQAITIALNVCNAVLCPAIISKCTQDPHSPIYITELFLWLDMNNQPLTLFTLHTAPDCAGSGGPFFLGPLFVIMMYLRGYLVISEAT